MCSWLSVRLEVMGSLAAFSAAVLTVEQRGNASTFGLVLSYALQITMLTSMTVCVCPLAQNKSSWVAPASGGGIGTQHQSPDH